MPLLGFRERPVVQSGLAVRRRCRRLAREFVCNPGLLARPRARLPWHEGQQRAAVLGLKYGFPSPLSLCRRLIDAQQGVSLSQIGVAAGILRREAFFIGNCFFDCLLGGGIALEERFLSRTLRTRTGYVRLHGLFSSLCGSDLSFGLVDSSKSPFNLCILKLALPAIVFNRGFCSLNAGQSLCHLCFVVVVIELDQ